MFDTSVYGRWGRSEGGGFGVWGVGGGEWELGRAGIEVWSGNELLSFCQLAVDLGTMDAE
jgi:hypothetical protein